MFAPTLNSAFWSCSGKIALGARQKFSLFTSVSLSPITPSFRGVSAPCRHGHARCIMFDAPWAYFLGANLLSSNAIVDAVVSLLCDKIRRSVFVCLIQLLLKRQRSLLTLFREPACRSFGCCRFVRVAFPGGNRPYYTKLLRKPLAKEYSLHANKLRCSSQTFRSVIVFVDETTVFKGK